jgi:hypothetical protein
MGRKSNAKNHLSSFPDTNQTNNNDTNDLYRKRLRSWKQTSTPLKSNHLSNDEVIPPHRSTMYTYPINLNHNRQRSSSRTIFSESLTTDESAFYGPSISYTSIETTGDLNNNHVMTMNVENKKRKTNTSSCESLSSQFSLIKTREILSISNNAQNISSNRISTNNLQLTCTFS